MQIDKIVVGMILLYDIIFQKLYVQVSLTDFDNTICYRFLSMIPNTCILIHEASTCMLTFIVIVLHS